MVAIAALVLIIINMRMLHNESGEIDAYIDRSEERYAEEQKKETEFLEDGAVVGENYTIKSTKAISDAYINGQDPSNLSEEDKKTYDLAVKVLDEATKGKTTVYEKELGIFEWIGKNISHDTAASTRAVFSDEVLPQDTPYGVLKSKSAVCVGYATTFRLLANMIGLECHIPHNDSHSWDLVKLDDNEWYLLDLYYATNGGTLDYQYFNLNEVIGSDKMDLSMMSHLPRANGKKYLYAVQEAKDTKNIYEVPKLLKKAIDDKKNVLSLRFSETPSKDEVMMGTSIADAAQYRFQENKPDMTGYSFWSVWCRDENDKYILATFIQKETTVSSFDLKSKEAKKMKKLLDKVFGKTTSWEPFTDDSSTAGSGEGVGDDVDGITNSNVAA